MVFLLSSIVMYYFVVVVVVVVVAVVGGGGGVVPVVVLSKFCSRCAALRSVFVACIFLFGEIIGEIICFSCSRFTFNFLKNNGAIFFRPYT